MKRVFLKIFSILVLVILFSTSVFGQQSQAHIASSPVVSKQVEPNIYMFTGGQGANTGAYIGEKEVLLIDSKQDSASVAQVLAAIKKLTNAPVTRLVNTHADGDHVFGNRFQPAGFTFIAHENCLKEFFAPSRSGTPPIGTTPRSRNSCPRSSTRTEWIYRSARNVSNSIISELATPLAIR